MKTQESTMLDMKYFQRMFSENKSYKQFPRKGKKNKVHKESMGYIMECSIPKMA